MLIGRNVLTFQYIEHILKLIHHFKSGSGTFKNIQKRKNKIDELSLGRLTDESFLKRIDSKLSAKIDKESYFSYSALPDDVELNAAINFFNGINDDRNFLVHNISTKWQFHNAVHREEAKNWLLKQYDDVMKHKTVLESVLNTITERLKAFDEYIYSDEGKKALDEITKVKNNEAFTIVFELTKQE